MIGNISGSYLQNLNLMVWARVVIIFCKYLTICTRRGARSSRNSWKRLRKTVSQQGRHEYRQLSPPSSKANPSGSSSHSSKGDKNSIKRKSTAWLNFPNYKNAKGTRIRPKRVREGYILAYRGSGEKISSGVGAAYWEIYYTCFLRCVGDPHPVLFAGSGPRTFNTKSGYGCGSNTYRSL